MRKFVNQFHICRPPDETHQNDCELHAQSWHSLTIHHLHDFCFAQVAWGAVSSNLPSHIVLHAGIHLPCNHLHVHIATEWESCMVQMVSTSYIFPILRSWKSLDNVRSHFPHFTLQPLWTICACCWRAGKRPLRNDPPDDRVLCVTGLSALVVAIPGKYWRSRVCNQLKS